MRVKNLRRVMDCFMILLGLVYRKKKEKKKEELNRRKCIVLYGIKN